MYKYLHLTLHLYSYRLRVNPSGAGDRVGLSQMKPGCGTRGEGKGVFFHMLKSTYQDKT